MYNVAFLPQLEEFRRNLFGLGVVSGEVTPRESSDESHERYSVPEHIETVPCHEDTNGEWVPIRENNPPYTPLEEKV